MNAGSRSTWMLLAIAVLSTAAGCRDQAPTTAPAKARPAAPSSVISDGAHGNGNTDVFFLPPLVANPQGVAGYGDAFQAGLPVAFKIREMSSGSVVREFAPSVVKTSLTDQHYMVNWDTKADNLDASKTYRIEAWIASRQIAYADVDVVTSGSQLKNVQTNEYIPLLDDRTLPIKVRVEQGWNCNNNSSCGSQVVTNTPPAGQTNTLLTTNDGENAVAFPANWFNPAAAPNGVVVTVEDVTQELTSEGRQGCGAGFTTMVHEQKCIRITTDPVVTVTNTVVVGKCLTDAADVRAQLLKIHEGDDGIARVKFLRNVPPPIQCPEHIGANPYTNPIARYAYATMSGIGRRVQKVFSPKSAYAFDLGVGGGLDAGDGFSVITSGIPLSMTPLAGDLESAPIGQATGVSPKVRLRSLHRPSATIPEGPNDATVTCSITSGGGTVGGGATALATHNSEEDADGVYTCPSWVLGTGVNTLKVSAAKLDDFVLLGAVATPFAGSATFTAFGLPTPTLSFNGFDETGQIPNALLTITNRAQYPNALFAASPSLPPCGLNTSASRTWVDIFDGGGNRIYGFCALGSNVDLDGLWFALGGASPASVYVTLTDRLSNQVYTSNVVDIPPRQLTPTANALLSNRLATPAHLSWQAVQGATAYEIERAFCASWGSGDVFGSKCNTWIEYQAATVDITSLDFVFVGAQVGRWRVRSIFPGGAVGPWTNYRYFQYTD